MNNLFLPFESKIILYSTDIIEGKKDLQELLNNGILYNFKKELKIKKLNDNKILLKTNMDFIINTQLYYLEKLNKDHLRIFSRNNIVWTLMYVFLFLFGLFGSIYSLIIQDSIKNITIFVVWTIFVFFIGNGIPKLIRYSQIEKIESCLLKK